MEQSFEVLLNQARQNHSQGNLQKALALLKKLLGISRNDKEVQALAYFEIAKIYVDMNKDEMAIKFFKKAIPLNPEVLIQEFEWFQNLKLRNKARVFNELEKIQAHFKDYLIDQTKGSEGEKQRYANEIAYAQPEENESSHASKAQQNSAYEPGTMKYAGFWKRVVATLVDGIVVILISAVFHIIILYGFGYSPTLSYSVEYLPAYGLSYIICILSLWLYYAIMESSRCQGTLGKMLLGIYVTDLNGCQIGIGKASGRYFLKVLLYSVPFFGFVDCLMVAVTEKKQAWHDMPVACLVLSK